MSRPITSDDFQAVEAMAAALMAALVPYGVKASADIRNKLRIAAFARVAGGDGTITVAMGDHTDVLFATGCQTSVTHSVNRQAPPT